MSESPTGSLSTQSLIMLVKSTPDRSKPAIEPFYFNKYTLEARTISISNYIIVNALYLQILPKYNTRRVNVILIAMPT